MSDRLSRIDELLGVLRTRQAQGEGTSVRLVVLEALTLERHLIRLDEYLNRLAGVPPSPLRGGPSLGAIATALGEQSIIDQLMHDWEGLDLQACTLAMREAEDSLQLLLSARRTGPRR